MTQRTTLCLVNVSGQDIREVRVKADQGFAKGCEPQQFVKGALANNDALCGYVELEGGRAWMSFDVTFADGTTLTFGVDQQDAFDKHVGTVPHDGPAQAFVWRSTGGNVDSRSHGTQGIYLRTAATVNHSSWMRDVVKRRPDVRLCDLVMPGSHDAGMYETHDYPLGGGGSWAKTQSYNFVNQLIAGSRYFDIRTCQHQGAVVTYHGDTGYGAYGASLSDILRDVKSFLQSPAGKDEVVILKFSHGYKDAAAGTVAAIQGLGDLLFKSPTAVNLATLPIQSSRMQGHVVAVMGDPYSGYIDPAKGLFAYHDIPVKENPHSITAKDMTVYDNYANDTAYQDMAGDQLGKLQTYGGLGKDYLFLLSWTCTGSSAVRDIEVLAGMANPWLPALISRIRRDGTVLPNVVYIDFVDAYLGGAILAANR